MEQGNITISEKQGRGIDAFPPYTMPVLVCTILAVILTAVAGGVLTWMSYKYNNNTNLTKQNITAVENEIKKMDTEGNLTETAKRLTSSVKTYNEYEKMDLDWKRFLEHIKDDTLKDVIYSSFAIDRKEGLFRIDGVAPSYRIVAEQLNKYSNDADYDNAELKLAVLRPESESAKRVAFTIEITPKKDAFMAETTKDAFDTISETENILNKDNKVVSESDTTGTVSTTEEIK
ncbi:MAG TPA: hypothetical protein PLH65_01600 [bacterium]|nr:hypothetical protein [bacterium]